MKTKQSSRGLAKTVAYAVAGLVLSVGTAALADETVSVSRASSEKTGGLYNAFEIAIAAGYTQGVGDVGAGVPSLTNSGGPGASSGLGLGWRIDPAFLVGVHSSGAAVWTRRCASK